MVVPDSLWNSPFWAGMLTGAALRGAHVFAVSPALENAPSSGFPQMSRAQEIFAEMILVQQLMESELEQVGGELHTGIYAVDVDVGDLFGRSELYYDRLGSSPLYRSFFSITPETHPEQWLRARARSEANRKRVQAVLRESGFEADYVVEDIGKRKPKLHLKAQLFLNRPAVSNFALLDWGTYLERAMVERVRQVDPDQYADLRETWGESHRFIVEEAARVREIGDPKNLGHGIGYLTLGSHNMDYRGMMMDGEVLYVTAGIGVLSGMRDLFMVAIVSDWVDDLEELEALVPAYSEWQRRVGRYIKYAL